LVPLPSAAVYWASHYRQASNEWILTHLLPAALNVRCKENKRQGEGQRGRKFICHLCFFCILHYLVSLPLSVPPTLPFQSSSPRASLLVLSSLLDFLHLPALRHHRQHLAPACLERLLRLAPLLKEASEEEEVSLHAGTKRKHDAPLACSNFPLLFIHFSGAGSGCHYAQMAASPPL